VGSSVGTTMVVAKAPDAENSTAIPAITRQSHLMNIASSFCRRNGSQHKSASFPSQMIDAARLAARSTRARAPVHLDRCQTSGQPHFGVTQSTEIQDLAVRPER